jgi:hypothetical protein
VPEILHALYLQSDLKQKHHLSAWIEIVPYPLKNSQAALNKLMVQPDIPSRRNLNFLIVRLHHPPARPLRKWIG